MFGSAENRLPKMAETVCRVRARPAQADPVQQALDETGLCLSAMPNSAFIVGQVWMAVSPMVCSQTRRPVGTASQLISVSSRDPL
jgi:hypothetical protein